MFTVKAGYSDDIEIKTSAERVREFFADLTNFASLMPGVVLFILTLKELLIGKYRQKSLSSVQ